MATRASRISLLLVAGALFLTGARGAAAGTNRWTPLGPYGGGAVVVAPSNPNIVFVYARGVFKSINGGASFHHLYPRLDSEDIWSLAIDPHDATRIYLATGSGVWTSSDGGISWTVPPPTFAIGHAMVVDPTNSSVIYAGLYKSVDRGQSWQPTNLSQASGLPLPDVFAVQSIAIDPQHPSTVYAGIEGAFCGCGLQTSSRGGVFKSLDGGVTWAPKDSGLPTNTTDSSYLMAVDPSQPSTIYLLVAALRAIYKSTNAGDSWTLLAGPGGSSLAVGAGGVVYTDTARSVDAGVTWSALTTPPLIEAQVVADPVNPLAVYASAFDGVVKSLDGGTSWQQANGGVTTARISAFAVDPSDPKTIYASTEFHIFKTTQGGGTWEEIGKGLPLGAVVGQSGLVIDPQAPSIVYATFQSFAGSGIAKSVDRGATWQVLNVGFAFSLLVDPAVPGTLYAIATPFGRGCNPLRSKDRGATWSCISSRADASAIVPDPFGANVLYAFVSQSRFLYKSADSGVSWHRADRHGLAKPGYDARLVIDPTNDAHLLLTVGNDVYASGNGANTWAPLLPGPGARLVDLVIDPRSPSHLYALTTQDAVLSSRDGGLHWTELDQGRPPFSSGDLTSFPQGTPGRFLQLDPQDSTTLYLADFGLYKLTQTLP